MAPITVTRLQRHVDLIIRSKASGGHLYTSVRRRLLQSRRADGGGGNGESPRTAAAPHLPMSRAQQLPMPPAITSTPPSI